MAQADDTCCDILLIGRRLDDNENLGLGYLLAAARHAGLRARMRPLNHWLDLDGLCRAVLQAKPRLVGLAFPDGGSALLPLTAGAMLRQSGYRGHITAGGPFATLARRWLLDRHEWLDSVVRHAGEVPLVQLARRLTEAQPRLDDLPAVSTRSGDGRPAPVLDTTMLELVPERAELPSLLGHKMAHMAATRGCEGRCAYCGPASLQVDERNEGRRNGHSAVDLTRAGVGGIRRRHVDSICDEMAELWHRRDVRYFYFVDEHLLPRRSEDALAFLSAFKRGLRERGVGSFGIGCMLRADRLQPGVLEAFVDLGLIRTFLGIELPSTEELRRFGRGGDIERALRSMRQLERLGVVTTSNIMLVHPYSTVETLSRGIDFLEAMGSSSFEATQMQIYHGTKLHEHIAAQGRLSGNPLLYGYRFDDSSVSRFAEVLARLRMEAFGDYSLAFKIHDAGLAVALAERLGVSCDAASLQRRLAQALTRSNALRIRAYRDALRGAIAAAPPDELTAVVDSARRSSALVDNEIAQVSRAVIRSAAPSAEPFAPMKAAAAGIVSFLLSSQLAACHDVPPPAGQPGAPATAAATAVVQLDPATSASPTATAAPSPQPDTSGKPTAEAIACTEQQIDDLLRRVESIVKAVDPCSHRAVHFGAHAGTPPMTVFCYSSSPNSQQLDEKIARKVKAQLSPAEFACLIKGENSASVAGDAHTDDRQVSLAIIECRSNAGLSHHTRVAVEIDSKGNVKSIQYRGRQAHRIRQCIARALNGLTFPCLSDRTVAPQPVIME